MEPSIKAPKVTFAFVGLTRAGFTTRSPTKKIPQEHPQGPGNVEPPKDSTSFHKQISESSTYKNIVVNKTSIWSLKGAWQCHEVQYVDIVLCADLSNVP